MLRISRARQGNAWQSRARQGSTVVESDGNINVTVYDFISAAQAEVAQVCIQFRSAVDKQCIYPARNGASAVDLNGEPAGCYCSV